VVKLLPILILVLLFGCGKKPTPRPRPTPIPSPTVEPSPTPSPTVTPEPSPSATPTPTASPTPSPTPQALPTPYPTPNVNLGLYLPPIPTVGKTMTVSSADDLSAVLQSAQDDPAVTAVVVTGGGAFKAPVILRRYTRFDSSTYFCNVTPETSIIKGVPITDYGCLLVADGVTVEGTWRPPQAIVDYFEQGDGRNPKDPYLLKVQALTAEQLAGTGTTILEPNYADGPMPSIEVFQALGDACCSHSGPAHNVVIRGFHIKGRQKVYDGGVRSTLLFGNCHDCAAVENYLEDTGSIGITFGGSALEWTLPDGEKFSNNFANNVAAYRNVFSGVAAANTATINTENAYIFNNYVRRPGHHDPKFGGGVCGHDNETNSEADHTRNIFVFNNLYDYEDAHVDGAGSAICLQDPYTGENRGKVVAANNVIIGGREDRVHRYLSNGFFIVGLNNFEIVNNYIFRTGQNALQLYNVRNGLIQDNLFDSTGGGGEGSVKAEGMLNTTFRRNRYIERMGLGISMAAGFMDICGSGNVYEGNSTPEQSNVQPVKKCP
jgi:hypothetical protein